MCVYLRVVVMIGSDEVVSSPALRRRSWVEEPCSVDSTRSAVRAAHGRTSLGQSRETGSGCTTEKIGRPATHWKSIKSWPDPMTGAAVGPAASSRVVPILPSLLSISPRLPPSYLLPRRPSRHAMGRRCRWPPLRTTGMHPHLRHFPASRNSAVVILLPIGSGIRSAAAAGLHYEPPG
uniref:Uncharacterized protein n=1 Tax=Aegilops tauschii subsp. strangulata TaxID=200361 RepID=A0A453FBI9_AEGTS